MTIIVKNQLTIACSGIIRYTNLRLHFFQFQYTLIWVGIELYANVGKCIQLKCFLLLSIIFTYYLRVFLKLFIEGSLNMVKLFIMPLIC